jgi:anti-sigma factor RsiW
MTDTYSHRLSEYVDDELTPAERLEIERHLLDCAACREMVEGLQRVVTGARSLDDAPPSRDLWPALRAALPLSAPARRINLSIPQALAAGVLLAVVSGLCVWLLLEREHDRQHDPGPAIVAVGGGPGAMTPVGLADPKYDHAIDDLTRLLAEERPHLSPKTVDALERNLATIDRAIAEAQAALAKDPSDAFLNSHLAQQRRTKLALLRQANQLARSGL